MYNWLESLADWFTYSMMQLDHESQLGTALNFFVYDTIKILILLFVIVFIMGIVNAYFPVERLRNLLQKKKLYGAEYFLSSLFGAITPFCSCSSVPLFIGFVRGGIPLGVTFSFLITSPLVNEVAIAMFIGLFGWKATLIYAGSGILLAVPMYANAAAIVPVIEVFVAKGVPLGTAIAFMMATVGLSLPEGTLLKKVMTMKLIAIFFSVVTVFIILSGYLFNLII